MIVEIHVNGKLSLEMRPQTEIERLVLSEMMVAADKGAAISMRWDLSESCPKNPEKSLYVFEVPR